MVFKGQDAWRKHPLLANCHANPFPHFRIAVGIFSAYVIADWAYHYPDQVEHYSESIVRYFTSPPVVEPPKVKFRIRKGDLDEFPIAVRPKGSQ